MRDDQLLKLKKAKKTAQNKAYHLQAKLNELQTRYGLLLQVYLSQTNDYHHLQDQTRELFKQGLTESFQ